jgi:hypothetical protein
LGNLDSQITAVKSIVEEMISLSALRIHGEIPDYEYRRRFIALKEKSLSILQDVERAKKS